MKPEIPTPGIFKTKVANEPTTKKTKEPKTKEFMTKKA